MTPTPVDDPSSTHDNQAVMYSSSPADAPLVREPLHAPVAHLIRGGMIEGTHYGSVVVLGADGEVEACHHHVH